MFESNGVVLVDPMSPDELEAHFAAIVAEAAPEQTAVPGLGEMAAMAPGPESALVLAAAIDPEVRGDLTDAELVGLAVGGQCLANWAVWAQLTAISELYARYTSPRG